MQGEQQPWEGWGKSIFACLSGPGSAASCWRCSSLLFVPRCPPQGLRHPDTSRCGGDRGPGCGLAALGSSSTRHEAASTWPGLPQSLAYLVIKLFLMPAPCLVLLPGSAGRAEGLRPRRGPWGRAEPSPTPGAARGPTAAPCAPAGTGTRVPPRADAGSLWGVFTQGDEGFRHKIPTELGKIPGRPHCACSVRRSRGGER